MRLVWLGPRIKTFGLDDLICALYMVGPENKNVRFGSFHMRLVWLDPRIKTFGLEQLMPYSIGIDHFLEIPKV